MNPPRVTGWTVLQIVLICVVCAVITLAALSLMWR